MSTKTDREIAEAVPLSITSSRLLDEEVAFLDRFTRDKVLSMLDQIDSDACEIAALERRIEELEREKKQFNPDELCECCLYIRRESPMSYDYVLNDDRLPDTSGEKIFKHICEVCLDEHYPPSRLEIRREMYRKRDG